MISNNNITIYHKVIDYTTHNEKWTRYNYDNVWKFGGKGAGINKGYNDANDVEIRIPYTLNPNISNFSIGDIIAIGHIDQDIEAQQDLSCEIYNITSIKDNTFGSVPHIHLGGK